ncbi:hypothetical protein SAMN05660649_01895 [Desulfotomaculum arcticum]|uniref:Uncharacterized protein n=2 Tax=Desulfotruncus TaxID=2867377 RepID=A0A1I2SF76_9FIRM|nr:hypothetical protein SAMN05660649_01895 [Desulfotomaculum arcticum] [Desulfotruncus arcticus DSM 17038]
MLKIAKNLIGAILFVVAVAVGVYLIVDSVTYPQMKPVSTVLQTFTGEHGSPVVRSNTLLLKYNEYSCGDVELLYRGNAPQELIGLDYNRLKIKYPESQGWKVTFRDNELDITRKVNGFCGMHKEYRHLGLYEGKLAVFQGPLGYDDIVLSVVNVDLDLLPGDIRDKIFRADRYNELPTAEQEELQKTIEFPSEMAIYSVLENFDELERD